MTEVRVLALHREKKKGRPFLCVKRILDEREAKCSNVLGSHDYKWRCDRPARYFIYTYGSNRAWGACRGCAHDLLDYLLERPPHEYAEREADEIEHRVRLARRRAHAGCVSPARSDPDGLCQRVVVFVCTTCKVYGGSGTERIPQRLCARHGVWHRKRGHGLEEAS